MEGATRNYERNNLGITSYIPGCNYVVTVSTSQQCLRSYHENSAEA